MTTKYEKDRSLEDDINTTTIKNSGKSEHYIYLQFGNLI